MKKVQKTSEIRIEDDGGMEGSGDEEPVGMDEEQQRRYDEESAERMRALLEPLPVSERY
jgi:hypothetical protein